MIDKPHISRALLPLGRYRHYKGREYRVIGVAIHSETGEPLVVYRTLYGDFGLWVRPLVMFQEVVDVAGEKLPRFAFMHHEVDVSDNMQDFGLGL